MLEFQPRQSLDDFKAILRSYARSLSNVCCQTSREKYELLEKLDKKIREGMVDVSNIQAFTYNYIMSFFKSGFKIFKNI